MKSIQYTIRNVPPDVNRALRVRAQTTGKSFNATVIDTLSVNTLRNKGSAFEKFYRASEGLTKQDHQELDNSLRWLDSLPNEIFNK